MDPPVRHEFIMEFFIILCRTSLYYWIDLLEKLPCQAEACINPAAGLYAYFEYLNMLFAQLVIQRAAIRLLEKFVQYRGQFQRSSLKS